MVDQTISEDSKEGGLQLDTLKKNMTRYIWIPEHRLLLFPVMRNSRSLRELQSPPHPAQSNIILLNHHVQSSVHRMSNSNLSHTASPASQVRAIPSPAEVTI